MSRSKTGSNGLPPPTPSEAAFEKVLRELDWMQAAPQPVSEFRPRDETDALVERLFAEKNTFLARDDYAGIGDREAFPTKVVGTTFEGRQDVVAGMVPGSELELRRQPQNLYDPNAIAVYFGVLQIGFLKKQIAKHLAPLIDAGATYRARIEHVTGGTNGKNFGLNIRVTREGFAGAPGRRDGKELGIAFQSDAVRQALIGTARPHEAQEAVLSRLDAGKNTLAVMGTGRGKSFCFQFAGVQRALESGQRTLVIYPLRALANDQYDALTRRLEVFGLRIFRANGSISADERRALMDALAGGAWDMVLATPEFLQFHRDAFCGSGAPSLVVVDEAHHVYESKHRPAYGKLGETIRMLGSPQIVALTATAGDDAFRQILADLCVDAWVIDPTIRENLNVVDARGTRDKMHYLVNVFAGGEKGIVYCNSRSEATKVAQALHTRLKSRVMFYHAGMPSAERALVEDHFRRGKLRVIVATSAFGEGIDLPDVRHVVLYHLNFDFTEFNQQAGRAGRDGEPASIHLLFGEGDRRINEYLIDQDAPTLPLLRAMYKAMREACGNGTIRMTYGEIARLLDLDKANERTIGAAVRIFEDEHLVETGIDDDGRFIRFLAVHGKIDMTKNERFAEGEAAREAFARFCTLILTANPQALERIVNRPIYPERVELRR